MARVLVTGGSGFIGSHLIDTLIARGDQVTAAVRATSNLRWVEQQPIERLEVDLYSRDWHHRLAGVDYIFHVAGVTRWLGHRQLVRGNVLMTRRLLQSASRLPSPPVFVYVSSLAAAGPARDEIGVRESDPCHPVSYYGRSKRAAEVLASRFADQVPISIVRPPIVLGERDRGTAELLTTIRALRLHLVAGYRVRRYSLVHVHDLVDAMLTVAERGQRVGGQVLRHEGFTAGCYHVADPQPWSWYRLGREIARHYGYGRWFVSLPLGPLLIRSMGFSVDQIGRLRGSPFVFSSDKAREALAGNWVCSTDKIQSELDWQPLAPLEQRIEETVQWFRAHGLK